MNEPRQRRFSDRLSGMATLINDGCKITGLVEGKGDFLLDGEIIGDCEVEGTVTMAANGFLQGTMKADAVIISGRVEGDIIAAGKVEITSSAKITGTVTGEAIAVAEGAIVDGVMTTTGHKDPVRFTEKRGSKG